MDKTMISVLVWAVAAIVLFLYVSRRRKRKLVK